LDVTDFSNTPLASEKDLDFSFDNDSLVQDFEEAKVAAAPVVDEAAFDLPQFDEIKSDIAETVEASAVEMPVLSNDALDFDMGDFSDSSSKVAGFENTGIAPVDNEAKFGNTMPALDMPTFDAPKFIPDALAGADEAAVDNVLDISDAFTGKVEEMTPFDSLNDESFEFLQADTLHAEPLSDDTVVLDAGLQDNITAETEFSTAEFNTDTDFNFDVNTISPESSIDVADNVLELNAFDLNTIDLDMNDGASTIVAEAHIEAPAELDVSDSEPIEVETKLDLVAAYIEMDDKVGAKELLEEVMKEGGAAQRKRAEALLAQIA
jgi:pilus assembly protein FimV